MTISLRRHLRAFGPAAIAAFLLLPSRPVFAAISIEPAFITARLDGGNVSEVVVVKNDSATEGKYRVQVRHFVYTLEGGVHSIDPDEHSLAKWVKTNPREFTLGPNGSRVVRLTIVPPRGLAAGEYWAALEFEPLEGLTRTASDSAGRTVRFKVLSTIYVPVIGTVGEATRQGELREVTALRKAKGLEVAATVANLGTGRLRLRGNCQILDSSGSVVAERRIGEATVLPGGVRRFVRLFPKEETPPTATVARVVYTSDQLGESLTRDGVIATAPPAASDSSDAAAPDGANAAPAPGR